MHEDNRADFINMDEKKKLLYPIIYGVHVNKTSSRGDSVFASHRLKGRRNSLCWVHMMSHFIAALDNTEKWARCELHFPLICLYALHRHYEWHKLWNL
jgi:hypothetical protein